MASYVPKHCWRGLQVTSFSDHEWKVNLWTNQISFSGMKLPSFPPFLYQKLRRNHWTSFIYSPLAPWESYPFFDMVHSHRSHLLSAQGRHILGRWREQPHGLPGRFVVAVGENQGLLQCEEGKSPVPNIRAGHPAAELPLQCCAEPRSSVCALPLQNHHLTHAEQKQRETSD